MSSGVESESPVTRSVPSSCFGGAGAPIAAGSKASAVTAGTRPSPPVAVAAGSKPPPTSSVSGESPPVSSCWAFWSGSRSATHSVGSPTASTMSRPIPGSICAAASRIEPPENSTSSKATSATAPTASRAL